MEEEARARLEAVEAGISDGDRTRESVLWCMKMLVECTQARQASSPAPEEDSSPVRKMRRIYRPEQPSTSSSSPGSPFDLQKAVEMAENAELGEWMSRRISEALALPGYSALVRLIDQCLLLSLDQVSPEEASSGDGLWLAKSVVKEVLYGSGSEMSSTEDFELQLPLLDWLLAYLSGSRPEILLPVLLDELAGFFSREDQCPTLLPYLQQAGILEFSALRAPEQVSEASLSLFRERTSDFAYYSLVQCCFAPRFLFCVAKAWLSSLSNVWNQLVSLKWRHPSLPPAWVSDSKPVDVETWLHIIVSKHMSKLHAVSTDIVLFLSRASPFLLDQLNQELSAAVVIGIQSEDLVLNNLKQNVQRLWDFFICQLTTSGLSTSDRDDTKDLHSPLSRTCQIVLLACDYAVGAGLLASATIYRQCNTDCRKLHMVLLCIRNLGILDRDKPMLSLWSRKVANSIRTATAIQIIERVTAIRHLVDPVFWKNCFCGSFTWKRTWKNVCSSLRLYWADFLSLLHREDNYDFVFDVLSVLKSLTLEDEFDPSSHLKGALGVYLHWASYSDDVHKWHHLRAMTMLRKIVVQTATICLANFTLLVNILLDFSTEAGACKRHLSFSSSSNKPDACASLPLVTGKLDRYGRLTFPPCIRLQSSSKLSSEASKPLKAEDGNGKAMLCHISLLLGQSLKEAMKNEWASDPIGVLGRLLTDRLEIPHEMPMTMEQYEEVLPKQVAASRHSFLIECIDHNPFLFKVLQIVMEQGNAAKPQICAELVRALLAENISKWHHQHNTDKEADRMELFDIIQLTVSAGWLPQPVASCGEIITLIKGEDVSSLLFIVWRCMHDSMAVGLSTSEGNGDHKAAGGLKDWEVQFLSILRRNVSRIGAYFARLYPQC